MAKSHFSIAAPNRNELYHLALRASYDHGRDDAVKEMRKAVEILCSSGTYEDSDFQWGEGRMKDIGINCDLTTYELLFPIKVNNDEKTPGFQD
jgi:hypothetical protein